MKPVLYALTAAVICLSATTASAGHHHSHGKAHHSANYQTQAASDYHLTNKDVMRLQRSLRDKGFYNGAVDGVWGMKTTQAVQAYQNANDLQESGSLSVIDLQNLGIKIDERAYETTVYETKGKKVYHKQGKAGYVHDSEIVYDKHGKVVYDANGNTVYRTDDNMKHHRKHSMKHYNDRKMHSDNSDVNYDNRTSNRLNRNQQMNINN